MTRSLWLELFAVLLVALGVILLLNSLGITHLDAGDVVGGFFAVVLILIGVYLLRRSRRPPRGDFRDVFLGTVKMGDGTWEVRSGTYQVGFGQLTLDLTKAMVPEGQHSLRLDGVAGQIEVVVPQGVGVAASGQVFMGALHILGQRAEGISRTLSVRSPDYESAVRRLEIEANMAMGEVKVQYATGAPATGP